MNIVKRRIIFVFIVSAVVFILLSNNVAFAVSAIKSNTVKMEEFTQEFLDWMALPEEEQNKIIMPNPHKIEYTKVVSSNPILRATLQRAALTDKYTLKDVIPNNMEIRNQQQMGLCWTIGALTSLETNLALKNKRNGTNIDKVYNFSERHMEYSTSRTFLNGEINQLGYVREVNTGGNHYMAESYLTNGQGAIDEEDMRFENNNNVLPLSAISGKDVITQVYDTFYFPNYQSYTGKDRTDIMNMIKQHIQNYGSVEANIHMGNGSNEEVDGEMVEGRCYSKTYFSTYCPDESTHKSNHSISVVGWDDTFSKDKFGELGKPSENGAWIIRNSYGAKTLMYTMAEFKQIIYDANRTLLNNAGIYSAADVPASAVQEVADNSGYIVEGDGIYYTFGDEGYFYISYEDVNISKAMWGIVNAADSKGYENIYQYSTYYATNTLTLSRPDAMFYCIFDKKTTGDEFITQISVSSHATTTYQVFINPYGTDVTAEKLKAVKLKAGDYETCETGYNTLEFAKPIEIFGDKFVVLLKVTGADGKARISMETPSEGATKFSAIPVETDVCFYSGGHDVSSATWYDMGRLKDSNPALVNGDATTKVFSSSTVDDDHVRNITITTMPEKLAYVEGDDFDSTGMVITAKRFNGETFEVPEDAYEIANASNLAFGQTSITIMYEEEIVELPINVEKNVITGISITTPPTKLEYIEGESFDETGMVITATYKNGKTEVIQDYNIVDGTNLRAQQTVITIVYDEFVLKQEITVLKNELTEIFISKPPTKTEYVVGQIFDKAGMVVSGRYVSGAVVEIKDYKIEPSSGLVAGTTYVTISYEGKTVQQNVKVVEKVITGIIVDILPNKTTYIKDKENLVLTGGTLVVTYNDGKRESISLTSEQISVSGFSNKTVGLCTLTVTYMGKTTSFQVEIVNDTANNVSSDFENSKGELKHISYYTYTDKNKKEFFIMDVAINGIKRNTDGTSYEYYYYLSGNQNESVIEDWISTKGAFGTDNQFTFTINTSDIKNYAEISSEKNLYLYIKEVASSGGNRSISVSPAMLLDTKIAIQIYKDDVLLAETEPDKEDDGYKYEEPSGDTNKPSNPGPGSTGNTGGSTTTNRPTTLPVTGTLNILMIMVVVSAVGVLVFIRYKSISRYTKPKKRR